MFNFTPLTTWGLILAAGFYAWFIWHQFIKEEGDIDA